MWGRVLSNFKATDQIQNCQIDSAGLIMIQLQSRRGVTIMELDAQQGNMIQLQMDGLNSLQTFSPPVVVPD